MGKQLTYVGSPMTEKSIQYKNSARQSRHLDRQNLRRQRPDQKNSKRRYIPQAPANPVALLPMVFFLILFVGTGTYLTLQGTENAFYQFPATICILPAILLGVLLGGKKFDETLGQFIDGVRDFNIISMAIIYLLAGAFATVVKGMGGVEATVNFGLNLIPAIWLVPGIFAIGALISTAMGTSMGTIAAIGPIALGLSTEANIPLDIMAGAILSGALFGDNLSIISDTTIAATRTQGCSMQDKFKENFRVAIPAALICLLIFGLSTAGMAETPVIKDYNWILIIPYALVLILALIGINVFAVLSIGIMAAGGIGLLSRDIYSLSTFTQDIQNGFSSVEEIFLLALFVGGLARLMEKQGGMTYIIEKLQKAAKSVSHQVSYIERLKTEVIIAALVSLVNLCTANNVVSIVISGKIAKNLARKQKIPPRRTASLLDIYSCVMQGLIPYGAQALLLASLFNLSPISVVVRSYYVMILAILSITVFVFLKTKNARNN